MQTNMNIKYTKKYNNLLVIFGYIYILILRFFFSFRNQSKQVGLVWICDFGQFIGFFAHT